MNLSFNEITLTIDEQTFLEKLYVSQCGVHESAVPETLETHELINLGLMKENVLGDDAFYSITELGIRYYLYSTQNNDRLFYANLRSWIAIAISVVSLFIK